MILSLDPLNKGAVSPYASAFDQLKRLKGNMIDHNKNKIQQDRQLYLNNYPVIGWREWISFPEFGIDRIKAKVDTGARTSALHAFALKVLSENGKLRIQFDIHPIQHNNSVTKTCIADVIDKRLVSDSGGHVEERYVINTPITIAGVTWNIDITLTERENMLFRMLLGRSAIRKRFVINPGKSFLMSGKAKRR